MDFSRDISKLLKDRVTELSYVYTNILDYNWKDWEITTIRSWIVMLYSHWEWFVKNSWEIIKKNIKNLSIPLCNVKDWFIKNNFIGKNHTPYLYVKIIASKIIFKANILLWDIPIKFSTEDNLTYPLFKKEFLESLCINNDKIAYAFEKNILNSSTFPDEYLDSWKIKKFLKLDKHTIIKDDFKSFDSYFIDTIKVLLFLRNNISHWNSNLCVSIDEYNFLYETVKNLLLAYKDVLIDYFENKEYLK